MIKYIQQKISILIIKFPRSALSAIIYIQGYNAISLPYIGETSNPNVFRSSWHRYVLMCTILMHVFTDEHI